MAVECFGFQLASPLPWLGRLPPSGRAKRGKVALDLSCGVKESKLAALAELLSVA